MNNSNENNYAQLSSNERASLLLDYWKQTSNVQQHFNDVSMKLRNFAVVVFSGFLTGVGLAIHKGIAITLLNVEVSAGVLFALAGMIATQLIHFMDTYWYHVFLKGAVSTSSSIEKEIKNILGVSELSDGISASSQSVCVISIFGIIHLPIGWKDYLSPLIFLKKVEVDSTKRHKIFYRWLLIIFVATGMGSMLTHPVPLGNENQMTTTPTITNIFINGQNTLDAPVHKGFIISGSNVRIRNKPSFQSEIINLLPIGKAVSIIDENTQKSWVNISYQQNQTTQTGWIHRDFLATLK